MSDLSKFLLARITEDEDLARSAIGKRVDISAVWSDMEVARHIDRWSSARVLAECESKRAIVAETAPRVVDYADSYGARQLSAMTLRLLAQPYASHPDYDGAWRV